MTAFFFKRLRAVLFIQKTSRSAVIKIPKRQVDASLDLLEIPSFYRRNKEIRFDSILVSSLLRLRRLRRDFDSLLPHINQSMSYAYLFKYIIIGDTGNNSSCFESDHID